MKIFNKTLIAAALLTTGAAAQAEVSGSVGIASAYLWRGFDLGAGSAAFSGSLDYAEGPFYAGIWGSSGDDSSGTEYDLYAGLTGEVGGVGLDLAYVSYNYPDCTTNGFLGTTGCDFEEVILGASFGMFGLTYADNTDDDSYYVAGTLDIEDFSFTVGYFEADAAGSPSGMHYDATYSMGDLAFTLSQSSDDGVGYSEEMQFVVSYSFPLDM